MLCVLPIVCSGVTLCPIIFKPLTVSELNVLSYEIPVLGQSLCTLGDIVASPIFKSKSITPVITRNTAAGI